MCTQPFVLSRWLWADSRATRTARCRRGHLQHDTFARSTAVPRLDASVPLRQRQMCAHRHPLTVVFAIITIDIAAFDAVADTLKGGVT